MASRAVEGRTGGEATWRWRAGGAASEKGRATGTASEASRDRSDSSIMFGNASSAVRSGFRCADLSFRRSSRNKRRCAIGVQSRQTRLHARSVVLSHKRIQSRISTTKSSVTSNKPPKVISSHRASGTRVASTHPGDRTWAPRGQGCSTGMRQCENRRRGTRHTKLAAPAGAAVAAPQMRGETGKSRTICPKPPRQQMYTCCRRLLIAHAHRQ